MIRRPPRSTRTDTLFPYTTLFRSAEQNGRRLVMVMSGMTSSNQRISESVRFMNWGFRAWQAHPIVAKGKQVSTAEVQMGDAGQVGLVATRDLTVTVPSGGLPATQAQVVYCGVRE